MGRLKKQRNKCAFFEVPGFVVENSKSGTFHEHKYKHNIIVENDMNM